MLEHFGHPCSEPSYACAECGCRHKEYDLYPCETCHSMSCHDSKRQCSNCCREGCVLCIKWDGHEHLCKECR